MLRTINYAYTIIIFNLIFKSQIFISRVITALAAAAGPDMSCAVGLLLHYLYRQQNKVISNGIVNF